MFNRPRVQADFILDPAFISLKKHFNFNDVSTYAEDFGRMKSKTPLAVFTPPSIEVLQAFLVLANKYQVKMTVRGKGNSAYGQSQTKGGVIIDLKNMNVSLHYKNDDHSEITVPAFKTWHDLTEFTKADNKTVPVTPDNLDLTVGGTLSFATLGGTSGRVGSGADNVSSLDVLTLDGQFQTCSASNNPDLFNSMLCGMGQCGIIINATIPLITAKKQVNLHFISYDDISAFLKEQKLLYDAKAFDHIKGFIKKTEGHWEYVIEAASFHDGNENQEAVDALKKLSSEKKTTQTMSYWDFINMVTGFVNALRDEGKLNAPHPWYNILMPENAIEAHLEKVLDSSYLSGADPIIVYPMDSDHFKRPLFSKPASPTFYLLGVLNNTSFVASPDYPFKEVLKQNQSLYAEAKKQGGYLYPVDATPLSEDGWRQHYGNQWDKFLAMKNELDPHRLLGSGVNIFEAKAELTLTPKAQ